jgi:hypothetical protein
MKGKTRAPRVVKTKAPLKLKVRAKPRSAEAGAATEPSGQRGTAAELTVATSRAGEGRSAPAPSGQRERTTPPRTVTRRPAGRTVGSPSAERPLEEPAEPTVRAERTRTAPPTGKEPAECTVRSPSGERARTASKRTVEAPAEQSPQAGRARAEPAERPSSVEPRSPASAHPGAERSRAWSSERPRSEASLVAQLNAALGSFNLQLAEPYRVLGVSSTPESHCLAVQCGPRQVTIAVPARGPLLSPWGALDDRFTSELREVLFDLEFPAPVVVEHAAASAP